MAKQSNILDALKVSLSKPSPAVEPQQASTHPLAARQDPLESANATPAYANTPAPKPLKTEPQALQTPPKQKVVKVSVALYPSDLARLETVRRWMSDRGIRNLSDSEALRLMCRAAELAPRFEDLYRDMRHEDGRRKT